MTAGCVRTIRMPRIVAERSPAIERVVVRSLGPRDRIECRTDLRQLGEIGVAQDEADVGMRDQPAFRVDDIRLAMFADLDLRDHIPDELEIDFGNAHAGIAPCPGNGERHVGL